MSKPKWLQLMESPDMPPPMRAQLVQMEANARKWKAEHPNAELLYEFPLPQFGGVIGSIDEVIEGGAMRVNPQAVELFKAMWPWHRRDSATLSMTRYVMLKVYGDETAPPNPNR